MKKPGACAGPERPAPAAAENSRPSAVAGVVGPARPHQTEGMCWRWAQQAGPSDFEKNGSSMAKGASRTRFARAEPRAAGPGHRSLSDVRALRRLLEDCRAPLVSSGYFGGRNSWKAPEIWPLTPP